MTKHLLLHKTSDSHMTLNDPTLLDVNFLRKKINKLINKRYSDIIVVTSIRSMIRNGQSEHDILLFAQFEYCQNIKSCILEFDYYFMSVLSSNLKTIIQKHHEYLDSILSIDSTCYTNVILSSEEFANKLEENICFEIRTVFPFIISQFNDHHPL